MVGALILLGFLLCCLIAIGARISKRKRSIRKYEPFISESFLTDIALNEAKENKEIKEIKEN